MSLPAGGVFTYTPRKESDKHGLVQPVSHAGAVPGMNAQVSGPHDHVFAGLGGGQTGVGGKVK